MPDILTGLIPACHTPFHHDGRLNLAVVQEQAELFKESGLRSVFVAGTTGEFASLKVDERKALCERWLDVAGDSMRVAVHVGHNCQANAVALAAHARQAGAAAIAIMRPVTSNRQRSTTSSSFACRSPHRPSRCLCTITTFRP